MSIIEIIENRIARALRGLRFPYRARLTARNDAPGLQLAQADALAGEQAQAVEVLQQFGFSSGVPEGSDLIVIPLGGRTSASVIIATDFDREGELIGSDALNKVREVAPDLPVARAQYSSFT